MYIMSHTPQHLFKQWQKIYFAGVGMGCVAFLQPFSNLIGHSNCYIYAYTCTYYVLIYFRMALFCTIKNFSYLACTPTANLKSLIKLSCMAGAMKTEKCLETR